MKKKPNIIAPFNDKRRIKDLVLNVINETWIHAHVPDIIALDGELITLTLSNKKFVFEAMRVDNLQDYVDVFLQGVKMVATLYTVTFNEMDIIITFNQPIAKIPADLVASDFLVKGKIVMNDITYYYVEIAQGYGLTTQNSEDIIF